MLECNLLLQVMVVCSGDFLCRCFIVSKKFRVQHSENCRFCWKECQSSPVIRNTALLVLLPAEFSATQVYTPAFWCVQHVKVRLATPFLKEDSAEFTTSPKCQDINQLHTQITEFSAKILSVFWLHFPKCMSWTLVRAEFFFEMTLNLKAKLIFMFFSHFCAWQKTLRYCSCSLKTIKTFLSVLFPHYARRFLFLALNKFLMYHFLTNCIFLMAETMVLILNQNVVVHL